MERYKSRTTSREKRLRDQAEVIENIKQKVEELRTIPPRRPLSLLCLQVSSTPNLIALISPAQHGQAEKRQQSSILKQN